MNFWEDYLNNPPFEVQSPFEGDPADSHAVLWRGYEDHDAEELWEFGSGRRWSRPPPLPSFVEHGGETLCGLKIQTGANMYGPRWFVFDDTISTGKGDPALLDLHGITCMTCRRKLMHGLSLIIKRLTSIRDSVGEDYVQKAPLVHGKHILSRNTAGQITGETYQYRCDAAAEAINPQLASDTEEFERITCPDCIANIEASGDGD